MSDLVSELQSWASTLPAWQQELIRVLSVKAELTDPELAVAVGQLMADHGIVIDGTPRPRAITREVFAALDKSRGAVKLTALAELKGVNAIAPGQRLAFEPAGLTIVFGDNGVGKTGYTRVLKFVGRAVAHDGEILPDVFADKPPDRITAKVDIVRAGAAVGFEVDLRADPPPELATISVFDARCADNYVSEANTIAFTPEPLIRFDRLVRAQNRLRQMLDERIARIDAAKPNFSDFAAQTSVATKLTELEDQTDADLKTLAALSISETERRASLRDIVTTATGGQAKARADAYRREALSAIRLRDGIDDLVSKVGPEAAAKLADLAEVAKTKQDAANAARERAFGTAPLSDIGSPVWRELWEAARRFYEHGHPASSFPPHGPQDLCPLCVQALAPGARDRLMGFEEFVQGTTIAEAQAAAQDLSAARQLLRDELVGACRTDFLAGLADEMPRLAAAVTAFVDAAEIRLKLMRDGDPLGDEHPLPFDPRPALTELATKKDSQAAEIRASDDAERLASLTAELAELDARAHLADRLSDAVGWIKKLDQRKKLNAARSALDTNAITRKRRTLAEAVTTQALRTRLTDELDRLRLEFVDIEVQPRGQAGDTLTELRLASAPTKHRLPNVLSDGEQRALALAFFMAEVTAPGQQGGLVLDDPVSSLDQERREAIAARLVDEANQRQVIVFTHDVAFTMQLSSAAEAAGVPVMYQTIWRTRDEVGMTSPDAPWFALRPLARLKILEDRLLAWPKPTDVGPTDYERAVKQWYEDLRETWERSVELDLFGGVVERFSPAIKTQTLKDVSVTPALVGMVNAGMTRCSRFTHDPAPAARPPMPNKQEMREDLDALREFRKQVKAEGKKT
jgi:energy-coupling factor transporter ATP-binding protein EcfA2